MLKMAKRNEMQQQLEQSDLKEQTLPYLATKPRPKILLASLIPSTSSLFHFFISLSLTSL